MNAQFLIVSYDIPSNRRRYKVMKTLEGFGTRVQYNVFECSLKPNEVNEMRRKIKKLIAPEDSIRINKFGQKVCLNIEKNGYGKLLRQKQGLQ